MQPGEMCQCGNRNSGFLLCSPAIFEDLEFNMKCAFALILQDKEKQFGTTAEKSGLSAELKECVDARYSVCWAAEVLGWLKVYLLTGYASLGSLGCCKHVEDTGKTELL